MLMPYIKPEDRKAITPGLIGILTSIDWGRIAGPGELNYAITKILVEYIKVNKLSYSTLNEVIGVLECIKLELYRRVAAAYEDKKIAENGDVFPKLDEWA